MNYKDYVCGTRFQDLADAFYLESGAVKVHRNPHTFNNIPVFYCHTHLFNKAIARIADFNEKVVLITHNSDGCVRDSKIQTLRDVDADINLLPSNVVKWYAQNVDLEVIPNKIVPIPIGLENRYCFDYDKAEMLFNQKRLSVEKQPKMYVNFNVNTNRAERIAALNACQQASSACTIRLGQNGDDYQRYLEDIQSHRIIVCPRGNGLDCHRTWEALYLGSIPIMNHIPSIEAMGIPTLFVKGWHEIYDECCKGNLDHYLYHGTLPKEIPQLSMLHWKDRISNAK
jgi:hypothetical protein